MERSEYLQGRRANARPLGCGAASGTASCSSRAVQGHPEAPCSLEPLGASPAAEQQQNRSFWRAAPRSRSAPRAALGGAGRAETQGDQFRRPGWKETAGLLSR